MISREAILYSVVIVVEYGTSFKNIKLGFLSIFNQIV